MSTVNNLWGAFQSDEDPSLQVTASAFIFGRNIATLEKFLYTTQTGKGGAEGNPAIEISFGVKGSSINFRLYDPTVGKVFYRGKEVLDTNSPDYAAGMGEAIKLTKGILTHIIKATGKTEEQIKAAMAVNINSFADMARVATQLVTDVMVAKTPIDLFLQYQDKFNGTATRTFLEIPTNLAFGAFLTVHTPGEWKEERTWVETENGQPVNKEGLRYVDGAGNIHRFQRDATYMRSNRAKEQVKAENAVGVPNPVAGLPVPNPLAPVAPGQANPAQAGWG